MSYFDERAPALGKDTNFTCHNRVLCGKCCILRPSDDDVFDIAGCLDECVPIKNDFWVYLVCPNGQFATVLMTALPNTLQVTHFLGYRRIARTHNIQRMLGFYWFMLSILL